MCEHYENILCKVRLLDLANRAGGFINIMMRRILVQSC